MAKAPFRPGAPKWLCVPSLFFPKSDYALSKKHWGMFICFIFLPMCHLCNRRNFRICPGSSNFFTVSSSTPPPTSLFILATFFLQLTGSLLWGEQINKQVCWKDFWLVKKIFHRSADRQYWYSPRMPCVLFVLASLSKGPGDSCNDGGGSRFLLTQISKF